MKLYKMGEEVTIGGSYVCLGCGKICFFAKGAFFLECTSCRAGTERGPEGYQEGAEFWKLLED